MKTLCSKPLLFVTVVALLLSACASSQPSATTVSLLTSAGFRLRTPETPKQKEIFATLPSYKVESIVVNGRKFYVYKDPEKGAALVGHEAEYQHYRQLANQERASAAHERMMITSDAEAANWRGAASSDWWH
jgi:hypothetical protein